MESFNGCLVGLRLRNWLVVNELHNNSELQLYKILIMRTIAIGKAQNDSRSFFPLDLYKLIILMKILD